MIREVYIDDKLVDVRPDNEAGYMFSSPIFRDITKIISNRTTTYKLPKTSKNLAIFGLSNDPEIISNFPYKTHSFREERDGLLFINGVCILLKSSGKDIEISVVWGATTNLLSLKDLKLRDINIPNNTYYVDWGGSHARFLKRANEDSFGFIKVDYGKGLTDFRYMRPAITIQGILDIIKRGTSVTIVYPDRFIDIFKKTWIPLFDINANEITWDHAGYRINCTVKEFLGFNDSFSTLIYLNTSSDPHGILSPTGVIEPNGDNYGMGFDLDLKIRDNNPPSTSMDMVLSWNVAKSGTTFEEIKFQRVAKSSDGYYKFNLDSSDIDETYSGQGLFAFIIYYIDSNEVKHKVNSPVAGAHSISLTMETKEVQYGEDLPIIANLPDLSVLDFLKTIMQMYGLFAYYDYRKYGSSTTVEFISIDDIYKQNIQHAYNWTHKIIPKDRTRMEVSYSYGDYAQTNYFRYEEDSSVYLNVDGSLSVGDTTLSKEKDVVNIPFAPSINKADDSGVFASIKLFNSDGSINQVAYRLLYHEEFYTEGEKFYITAKFIPEQHFKGDKGLLAKYYKAYQLIIEKPLVVEFSVYLDEAELHLYREVYPVFVDGIYYMIIEMTATNTSSGKSLCRCKAIRMPFVDVRDFE